MSVEMVFPFLSSAIMLAFVVAVLQRWWVRRHSFLLLWGVGLAMFCVGSLAEAYFTIATSDLAFRAWYLFGAMLTAGWIGQGTVYLLARRNIAHVSFAIVLLLSVLGVYGMIAIPLNAAAMTTQTPLSEQYREVLQQGAWVRLLTPFFNVYGLVTMVGGAIYSAFLFWRKRSLPQRMWGNVLIASGALVASLAGTLTRLGSDNLLYAGEVASVALMFSGFLLASQRAPQPKAQAVHASGEPS